MKYDIQLRLAIMAALACALLLGASPASAHLIPARQGTVNIVGAAVYTVLSVPASSLHGADDNGDGVLDMGELERHEAELRAEIDRRLVILDGPVPARTVRIDLILSPEHDAAGDRGGEIVVLKHVEIGAPPVDLRVRCDLFGARESERDLRITATRHPASGTETEVVVLRPGATEHSFFPPPPQQPILGTIGGAPRGALALITLVVIATALASRARARRQVQST